MGIQCVGRTQNNMRDDKYDNINEPEETEDGHNYDFRELGDGDRKSVV